MKLVASLLTIGTLLPAFVIRFESLTGLSNEWNTNRPAVESRVKQYHTVFGQFYQKNYDTNITEIGKYDAAYKCASGTDTSGCLAPKF